MPPRTKKPVTTPNTSQRQPTVASQSWSGPLPPPAALQQFDQIIPNGADRILRMAEQEQANRHELERVTVQANIELEKSVQTRARIGLIAGAAVSIVSIIGSVVSVSMGAHPSVSITLVGVTILGIVKTLAGKDKA